MAPDQHPGRPEGARRLHANRRAQLLPGVRTGVVPRQHWFCQPGDHQRPQTVRLQRHGPQSSASNGWVRLQQHDHRQSHRRAAEPHAGRETVQQRFARYLLLVPVLCELWRPGRRRLRIHQVQRRRHVHADGPSCRRLESHGFRPVERSAGGRPFDASAESLAAEQTVNMGDIASTQWQANLYTRTFIDDNKDGISQVDRGGNSIRQRRGAVARRQLGEPAGHGLHRHRQFQRDVPVVQLVHGGNRRDPLQEHRHARRV